MQDIKYVYTAFFKDFKKFSAGLFYLFPAMLFYQALYTILNGVRFTYFSSFSQTGVLLWGFIIWAARLFCMTHYAGLSSKLFERGEIVGQDLYSYRARYLSSLSQVYFLIYIVEFFAGRLLVAVPGQIYLIIFSIWQIFIAPAYEAVYIGHEPGNGVPRALVDFWKDNGLSTLPYLAMVFVGNFIYWNILGKIIFIPSLSNALVLIVKSLFMLIYFYSKAVLFRILFFSTPRSRAFHHRSSVR